MGIVERAKSLVIRNHWYQQGQLAERERIIKMLEEDGERNYISQETFDYVAAIVKGEDE